MPDRFVRDGLLTSTRFGDLPDTTQMFYIRLLLVADDFGCFDGREGVCASQCYPLKPPALDEVATMLTQLQQAEMIVRYSNGGKPYIAIQQWRCGMRGRRKFPAPPVDVDLGGTAISGKFDRDIGWQNPPGTDAVSILLDAKARPVNPQPDEWRPRYHLVPPPKEVGERKGRTRRTHNGPAAGPTRGDTDGATSSSAASHTPPATAHQRSHHVSHHVSHPQNTSSAVDSSAVEQLTVAADVAVEKQVAPPVPPAVPPAHRDNPSPTTSTNGEIIEFREGSFVGLSEEQRVKWQAMFDDLRIPEQVDHAAAWLEVHPDERSAIQRQGLGFGQFLVRWLLREARSPRTGHAS